VRLPPYAKQAINRADWPQISQLRVYMSWEEYRPHYVGKILMGASSLSVNVVVPEDESPAQFRWDWVEGRSVVIVGHDKQEPRIDQLTPLLAATSTEEITWLATRHIIPIHIARREIAA